MVRSPFTLLIAGCAAVAAQPARSQSLIYSIPGSMPGDSFGTVIAVIGDVNADGHPDFVVPGALVGSNNVVTLRSGLDGHVLRTWSVFVADHFGADVAGPGDVDGDGVPDILIGAPGDDTFGFDAGQAFVYSGATGAQVLAVHGNGQSWACGSQVFATGDQDGDGRAEFCVANGGLFEVHSGATGALRYVLVPPAAALKQNARGIDDVSGDGVPDIAIGKPFPPFGSPGIVDIYSGANGSLVRTLTGTQGSDEFGRTIADAGDFDHDGVRDLLVSAPQWGGVRGRVAIVSPVTGATLLAVTGLTGLDHLGYGLAGGGDLDGDGVLDIVTAAQDSFTSQPWSNYVACFSGSTGSVIAFFPLNGPLQTSGYFATALLGDIDLDGKADFAVGVPGVGATANHVDVVRGSAPYGTLGTPSCAGDGSLAPCPCGNLGASGEGCLNLTGHGARLSAYGSASIAANDTGFDAIQLPTNTTAVLFVGTPTTPASFGDGLRCAGAAVRLGIGASQGIGARCWGPHLQSVGGWTAGSTRTFQALYRSSVSTVCMSGFNLTNGTTVTFVP